MTRHDSTTVDGWLDAMTVPLQRLIDDCPAVCFIGIRRGGVDVAALLRERVSPQAPFGELDIAFYRDDFGTRGLHPTVGPSRIDFDVRDRTIVLVDDVLASGRTVRAALNEIFDFGRPARVVLAVLVERVGHELPIRADISGVQLDVAADEYIDFDAESRCVSVARR